MKIEYAGPRPMISHHGVTFKEGKEDKYVYLMIGIQILNAIDKSFDDTKSYTYDLSTKRLSNQEMLATMLKYEPKLEEDAQKERASYSIKLEEEINTVENRGNLSEIDKKAWVNNLKIMKEYRIQRAVNKIYYMHCIHQIGSIIKREQIKEIDAPFYEKFWHVLQTIQGDIANMKSSLRTNLEIETNSDEQLIAKLYIQGY